MHGPADVAVRTLKQSRRRLREAGLVARVLAPKAVNGVGNFQELPVQHQPLDMLCAVVQDDVAKATVGIAGVFVDVFDQIRKTVAFTPQFMLGDSKCDSVLGKFFHVWNLVLVGHGVAAGVEGGISGGNQLRGIRCFPVSDPIVSPIISHVEVVYQGLHESRVFCELDDSGLRFLHANS